MSLRRFSRVQVNAYESICFLLCLVLVLSSLPWPARTTRVQGNSGQVILSRQSPPDYKLPNLNEVLDEGRTGRRTELPRPPLKPSTLCGYRDRACQELKNQRDRIGQTTMPESEQAPQPAKQESPNKRGWLNRLGERLSGALSVSGWRTSSNPVPASGFIAPEQAKTERPAAAKTALSSAAVFTPPPFPSLTEARLDPHYRTGGEAEDLFSGNLHWSLPLVSLPGRGGLDLNITLHYNSLVWAKYSGIIEFDYDYYPTLTPGFRLGFPELQGPFTVRGYNTYVVMLPSGRRVEMRLVSTNKYEAIDSSYLYLVVNPGTQTATLYGTDGTQWRYAVPITGYIMRCTQVIDANGNYLTIAYKVIGGGSSFEAVIDKITDTLGRVITFNYDINLHLLSITQNWGGQTFVAVRHSFPIARAFRSATITSSIGRAEPAPAGPAPISTFSRMNLMAK
jgi:hypothetical protein